MKKLFYLLLLTSTWGSAQQLFNLPFHLTGMRVYETATDGSALFDLSIQRQIVQDVENYSAYTVTFYQNYQDAQNAVNPISNETNYLGSNFEQVYARISQSAGSVFYVEQFGLNVLEDGIVSIPDANFKSILLTVGGSNSLGITVAIDANSDGEIQLSEANEIYYLNLDTPSSSDNISDLTGISAFGNLVNLNISDNQLTTFDPFCLNGMGNLRFLYASNCTINALYVNSLSNLKELEFQNNSITTIDVSNLIRLTGFASGSNPLTSLSINHLVNLTSLKCYSNNLTSLDLSFFPKLALLQCMNNQLTTLDASQNTELNFIQCNLNNLTSLNLKNGRVESSINFQTNPNLEFICVDEAQFSSVQAQLNSLGMTATVLNSYCSFTPGGDYNTITGAMIFDANNNGCDVSDAVQPHIKININDGTNPGATFTNNNGNYNFYTQAGNFSLTPSVENQAYFNFSPVSANISFANSNNNTTTQNFCISANGVHNDIEVVIAPTTTARPGFDAQYKIVFKNKGNQTVSGNVTLGYDDTVLDFVSATNIPSTQSTGILNWSYTNLLPFENRSFYVTFNVNSPTETPAVNIGDALDFTVSITPIVGDESQNDNQFLFTQTVVGSFDPNDISCLEGSVVPPSEIGNYLHYIINFENTGTAEAENIVVSTAIDPAQFDVNSLQMLNTSHNAYIRQTGNFIEFIFQNIALETGGHGNILLKIRTKSNLVTGDAVAKRADIFFDYNAPIDTGLATTTFQSLSSQAFETDNSVSIHPNPSHSIITINGKYLITSLGLYDLQGRLLHTQLPNATQTEMDLSSYNTGTYFVKATTERGIKVHKVIKE